MAQYSEHLFLVDLDLPELSGFREFISCWIYKSTELTFVVDPGPSATVPVLVSALNFLEISNLDYILLSQIHLDHAGGTGILLQQFPQARVNCHPRGIPHLINPEKLWQGSLQVLGKYAEAFGAVEPLTADKISYQNQIHHHGQLISVIEAPGHAPHHICYHFKDLFFAAEVAGVSIPLGDDNYQRIATPPRFIYEVYKKSLDKAGKIPAKQICLGHHGMRCDPQIFFSTAQNQLKLWMEVIQKHFEKEASYNEQTVLNELLNTDPALSLFPVLASDIQHREKHFCLNSIRGIYKYFKRSPE